MWRPDPGALVPRPMRLSRRVAGRRACRGQAAIELVAMVPLLVAIGVLAWQLAAVLGSAQVATEQARRAALASGGSGTVTVERQVTVPRLMPGLTGLKVRARAVVRGE